MACFLVPLGEAVAVTVAKKLAFKKNADSVIREKFGCLEKMLYGGSFFLAIEHVCHGEVVFYPPFLTAMENAGETAQMLHEMATVGTTMAVAVTLVWTVAEFIKSKLKKSDSNQENRRKSLLKTGFHVALGTILMFSVDGVFATFA